MDEECKLEWLEWLEWKQKGDGSVENGLVSCRYTPFDKAPPRLLNNTSQRASASLAATGATEKPVKPDQKGISTLPQNRARWPATCHMPPKRTRQPSGNPPRRTIRLANL